MIKLSPKRIAELAEDLSGGDAKMKFEIKAALAARAAAQTEVAEGRGTAELTAADDTDARSRLIVTRGVDRELTEVEERIIAGLEIGARPIARIRDNQVTTEFLGKALPSWVADIAVAKPLLDRAIPAVGRVEVTNGEQPWVGTGWLIADDILVTNRHVASEFAFGTDASGFVFKAGARGGRMSSEIDFLEEEGRADEAEYPIVDVLWIASEGQPDVAFLRVRPLPGKPPLPKPIELADTVPDPGSKIAAIGYPAKVGSGEDNYLAVQYFGEVYEKKRLALGYVGDVTADVVKHDCSTLNGNSGSVLIDLRTGKAVGLHRSGYLTNTANLAVPAPVLRDLLRHVRKRPTMPLNEPKKPLPAAPASAEVVGRVNAQGGCTIGLRLNIPIDITVRVGVPVAVEPIADSGLPAAAEPIADSVRPALGGGFDDALAVAAEQFQTADGTIKVRDGYRFKNGWITDERVIVIEVREKLTPGDLAARGIAPFPSTLQGIGIDVRTAALPDQLIDLGVKSEVLERPSKPAKYREPPGAYDEQSGYALIRTKDVMDAVFCVSPDSGFPNLHDFLSRVRKTLTATMYEWDAGNHISSAIENAMSGSGSMLRMVTQYKGVGGGEATAKAVEDMKARIGRKFKHTWAATSGPTRLVQGFYHIKVASRDGEEFWLSSGNWKDSNQPDIDPAGEGWSQASVFDDHNREWHAIIRHEGLANLFQKYIEFDFDQAKGLPLPLEEADEGVSAQEFFVPLPGERPEHRRVAKFFKPLLLKNEMIDVHPLLTPDRDAEGNAMFMKELNAMVRRARTSVLLQNQSLGMTGEDNDELLELYETLVNKQKAGLDVRVIIRDSREFRRAADIVRQQELIERLKGAGFDTSPKGLRLQWGCHTKAVIVDAREVLFGSQNMTNGGALHNRDASLLIRSPDKVAKYFGDIFEYDWDNLTHNEADESVGGVRRALPGEATPQGYRRLSLAEMLAGD